MVTKRQKPITRTVKGFNWKVIGRFKLNFSLFLVKLRKMVEFDHFNKRSGK